MRQRVGTCSLCGGDVMGVRGAYWSTLPPPPDECASCGAMAASDVIPMHPAPHRPSVTRSITTTETNLGEPTP